MGNQQPNSNNDSSIPASAHQNSNHHPGQQLQQHDSKHYPTVSGGAKPTDYNNNFGSNQNTSETAGKLSNRNSSSDASMTCMEDVNDTSINNKGNGAVGAAPYTYDIASLSVAEDDSVPTVFRWEHGGRQVYITGTFNGWSRQIPMHRSGNDFTYIHNLKRGKHAFKFIVDDEWRFAPDQPTVADIDGRINNFIDVTDFKAYTGDKDFEREKAAAEYGCYYSAGQVNTASSTTGAGGAAGGDGTAANDAAGGGAGDADDHNKDNTTINPTDIAQQQQLHQMKPDPDGEVFSQNMPDLDEYNKEPPPLPPHLRHIILNKPPQLQDTAALPVPQHVALNHLYCTAIKDNMMVLGITQRFRTKFVTTVYYSPCAS